MEEDENISSLVDIKRWKYQGQFVNRFFNTCPQPFNIDATNDRPMEETEHMS